MPRPNVRRVDRPSPVAHLEPLEHRRLLSAVVGLTTRNQLLVFDTAAPETILARTSITGTVGGERVTSIDFRPATGELIGVGSSRNLYVIEPSTGAATRVGSAPLAGGFTGTESIDFNPVVDRIRLVTADGDNARANPITGATVDSDTNTAGLQLDADLAFAGGDPNAGDAPLLVGAAYTNNLAAPATTTLFAIDTGNNVLVRQGSVNGTPTSPNTGQLTTIGALGVDVSDIAGFDVQTATGADRAFASLLPAGASRAGFYAIDLATGAATEIGTIASGARVVRDIALVPAGGGPTAVALNTANELLVFDAAAPTTILARVQIDTGTDPLFVIDARPATGGLVGLGGSGRLYDLIPELGAATAIDAPNYAPSGNAFGLDFNPTVDRLRLVSDLGQNLRLNPDTGLAVDSDTNTAGLQLDAPLAYAAGDPNAGDTPRVVASAYTNSVPNAANTTLFAIDFANDVLVRQGSVNGAPTSPNTGQLFTVGALGLDATELAGMDVVTTGGGVNTAYAAVFATGQSRSTLHTVNTTTGALTPIGTIAGGRRLIRDLALIVPTA